MNKIRIVLNLILFIFIFLILLINYLNGDFLEGISLSIWIIAYLFLLNRHFNLLDQNQELIYISKQLALLNDYQANYIKELIEQGLFLEVAYQELLVNLLEQGYLNERARKD